MPKPLLALIVCLGLTFSPMSQAAIYGENNLDDNPYKTQCEWPEGEDAPPVGIVAYYDGETVRFKGTGALVERSDVVVTAAHNIDNNTPLSRRRGDIGLFFAVWQADEDGACTRAIYFIERLAVNPNSQNHNGFTQPHDYALIKLTEEIPKYRPIKLPTISQFYQITNTLNRGLLSVAIWGFGSHSSINKSKDLSIVSGSAYLVPYGDHDFSDLPYVFLHDADTVPGFSGAPVTVKLEGETFFFGVHKGAASETEGAVFDVNYQYSVGTQLTPELREMIADPDGAGLALSKTKTAQ